MNKTSLLHTIFIGNSAAGKSSIYTRLISNKFNNKLESTIGASMTIYNNQEYNFKINLWDTAGQERYSPLIPLYIRSGDVVLMVLDICGDIKKQINKNLDILRDSNCTQIINFIFLINKCDLKDSSQINIDEYINYIRDYYNNNFLYYEKEDIIKNILEKHLEQFNNNDKSHIILISAKDGTGFDNLNLLLSNYNKIYESNIKNDNKKSKKNNVNINDENDSYENYFKNFKVTNNCSC